MPHSPAALLLLTLLAAGPGEPPREPTGSGLVLLAGGDVTLGYHLPEFQEELRQRGVSEAERIAYPFARIASLTRQADIFLINLEGTLTAAGEALEKNFTFRADPAAVAVLQAAGVDVVSLANNHAFDYGEEGLAQTRATLLAAGIAAFGAGRDLAEARRPAILMRHGLRVGFLGYLFMGDHTIEPEVMYATPLRPGVAGTHKDLPRLLQWIEEDIRALRPQVDLLVVVLHGGREGTNLVQPYQRRIADTALAAGADLLVGHHSHTLQGFERRDGAYVAYSLGNLMFAGNWNPSRKESALLRVTFRGGAEAAALAAEILPLAVDRQPVEPFQPRLLEGEAARRVHDLMHCYATATTDGACEAALEEAAGTRDGIPAAREQP